MNTRLANLILLAICLGLLGTLGVTLYLLRGHPISAVPPGDRLVVTNTLTQTQIEVRKINASNLLAGLAGRPWSWAAIESTNYQVFIFNLRNFGCPEETIKDIILTDVAKTYARRRAALLAEQDFQYWRPQHFLDEQAGLSAATVEQLQELKAERDNLVKQLLNVDFETELAKYAGEGTDEQLPMYGFLDQEKRDQIVTLRRQYDQRRDAVYRRSQGLLLEQDEAELEQIAREEELALAGLLTEAELQEYQLRYSDTAVELRSGLAAFEPTEEEFREIYRLRKVVDQTLGRAFEENELADPEQRQRVEEQAQGALSDELQKVLGEERYAEYVRAQDEDYQNMLILTDRLNLPRDLAGRVYQMKEDAIRQQERVEADAKLSPAQRRQALLGIARETEKSLASALGKTTFQAYRESGAGWLEELRESALDTLLLEEEHPLPPLPPALPSLPPALPPPPPPFPPPPPP